MPVKIDIKGMITTEDEAWFNDIFDIPYTTASKVNNLLESANGKDIEVIINSGGGYVSVGSEIYTALKSYPGNVSIKIVGSAHSAASVIAMAGYCEMSPSATIMIHNATTSSSGDYRQMDLASDKLKTINQSIINTYKLKTGLEDNELKNLMDKETWFTAEEAKELGFIDEVMFENENIEKTSEFFNSSHINMNVYKKLKEMGSAENIKNYIINERIKDLNLEEIKNKYIDNQNIENKGDEIMDLERIKKEHPDIYNQIRTEASTEAINAERERIKAIDEVALPGYEELVENAKADSSITAQDLSIQILKSEKALASQNLEDRKDDAKNSGMDKVEGSGFNQEGEEAITSELIEKIANAANKSNRTIK